MQQRTSQFSSQFEPLAYLSFHVRHPVTGKDRTKIDGDQPLIMSEPSSSSKLSCIVSDDSDLLVVLWGFGCICVGGRSKPMGEGDRIRTLCILASQGLSQRQVSWREVKPMRGFGTNKRTRSKRTESEKTMHHRFIKKFSFWPCEHLPQHPRSAQIFFCSITLRLIQEDFACSVYSYLYRASANHKPLFMCLKEKKKLNLSFASSVEMFKIDLTHSLLTKTNSHRCHCDFQTHSVWQVREWCAECACELERNSALAQQTLIWGDLCLSW